MAEWTGNNPDTLAEIRVLDLTRLLPGPFCTILLADLGADVIKVEDPSGGDYARWFPPTFGQGKRAIGAFFSSVNRGKRSLALNLKKAAGREILLDLARRADVLVESFRPGVMDRLGVGPGALREASPNLVYCAISGYGQGGPYRLRAGHDLNYLAACGALDQTAPRDGAPHPAGFQLADLAGGGLYAALAIVSALFHRERTGEGAVLDVSMTEGALSFMAPVLAQLAAGGAAPERGAGQLTGGLPCYRVYRTADDRYISLAALEPKFWAGFCQAVGRLDWMGQGHQPDSPITPDVEALFCTRTRDAWAEFFAEHDICVEPVRSPEEVLESELMRARRVFFRLGGASAPETFQVATPLTPPRGRRALRPPPRLGQHSSEILAELGLDPGAIERLAGQGTVALDPG
jgi:crotonobetainyl-CoA:carnitine CoA-transferase CaiB-like acyl-CoA transferase